MSNSATARTSTTASSTSSASNPASDGIVDSSVHPGVHNYPTSRANPIEIIACAALAGHIREIAARRGWPLIVRPLPAALHNRPQQIKSHAARMLATPDTQGARTVLGYADCGTYGALDNLAAQAGASRL